MVTVTELTLLLRCQLVFVLIIGQGLGCQPDYDYGRKNSKNESFPNNVGNWSIAYTFSRNSSCLLLTGAFQIQYFTNPEDSTSLKVIDVPSDAIVKGGKCEDMNERIFLAWPKEVPINELIFNFTLERKTGRYYYIEGIQYTDPLGMISHDNILDPSGEPGHSTNGEFFAADINHSYLCSRTENITGPGLTLLTANFQYEAFRQKDQSFFKFGASEDCANPGPPTTTTTMPTTTSTTTQHTYTTPNATTPKTTTTVSTTTPKPYSVLPFPQNIGNWSSTPDTDCVLLTGAFQLHFMDTSNVNVSSQKIDVPMDASVTTGYCANTAESITLSWRGQNSLLYNFTLNMVGNSTHYHISDFYLAVLSPRKEHLFDVRTVGEFYTTVLYRSFLCSSDEEIIGNLTVRTVKFQYEAFRPTHLKNDEFDDADTCKSDTSITASRIGAILGSITVILVAVGVGIYIGIRSGVFHRIRSQFRPFGIVYQSMNADID